MTVVAPRDGSAVRREARPVETTRSFRPDIQGVRAIAVLGVVLYHAHVGALSGGFVGVDIFFVLSGYLITGLLWEELAGTGRISLARFYGRRARRLLPAAVVVILVTALAARVWMPPLALPSVMKDGMASALYMANYRFAAAQTDYLHASAPPSPYQHFWSLGVEEQFYLLWPLLLIGSALLAWRLGQGSARPRSPNAAFPRVSAFTALALLSAGSAVLSVWLTRVSQPWAFFALPTRVWELGSGGMLALAAPVVWRIRPRLAASVGWVGLFVALASMFIITPATAFPGWAAFVPVLGTLAILLSGEALHGRGVSLGDSGGPARLLARRPFQFTGKISYSWYLWHWPFLILVPYAAGHSLKPATYLLVAAASGLAATASYHLVEAPIRTLEWLALRPRRSIASGLSITSVGAATCWLAWMSMPSLAGGGAAQAVTLNGPASHWVPAGARAGADSFYMPAPLSPVNSLTAQLQTQLADAASTEQVPSNLAPSLAGALDDKPEAFSSSCMDDYTDVTIRPCASGDPSSQTKVVLLGDSHAASWAPAVGYAASHLHWNLITFTKATCAPLLGVPEWHPILNRYFTECDTWRQRVIQQIKAERPALVILAMARQHYWPQFHFQADTPSWLDAFGRTITALQSSGAKVVVIGPLPNPQTVVPACLSAHLTDVTACDEPLNVAIDEAGKEAEATIAASANAQYLDVQDWFCTKLVCPVIVGNMALWRDDNHITKTWSTYLGPLMAASLAQYLPPPPGSGAP